MIGVLCGLTYPAHQYIQGVAAQPVQAVIGIACVKQ